MGIMTKSAGARGHRPMLIGQAAEILMTPKAESGPGRQEKLRAGVLGMAGRLFPVATQAVVLHRFMNNGPVS